MSFSSDMIARRDAIGVELATIKVVANNEYVLRLHEELRRIADILDSPVMSVNAGDDFGPFEIDTRGVT